MHVRTGQNVSDSLSPISHNLDDIVLVSLGGCHCNLLYVIQFSVAGISLPSNVSFGIIMYGAVSLSYTLLEPYIVLSLSLSLSRARYVS